MESPRTLVVRQGTDVLWDTHLHRCGGTGRPGDRRKSMCSGTNTARCGIDLNVECDRGFRDGRCLSSLSACDEESRSASVGAPNQLEHLLVPWLILCDNVGTHCTRWQVDVSVRDFNSTCGLFDSDENESSFLVELHAIDAREYARRPCTTR